MNKYIELLVKLNKKAMKNDDVPVSAIIVKNDKIIAKAYNKRNKNKNPLDHAEIIAIKKAAKKNNSYNLNDCVLITSLKPCKMCEEVIKESRIKTVYYVLENKKKINNKIKYINVNYKKEYFEDELKSYFKNKRK